MEFQSAMILYDEVKKNVSLKNNSVIFDIRMVFNHTLQDIVHKFCSTNAKSKIFIKDIFHW